MALQETTLRKNLWRTLIFLCPLVCVALFVFARAQSADAPVQTPAQTDPTFEKVVQPFFANNCFTCHNEERQTGDLSLEAFKTDASLRRDRATMKLILDKLNTGAMPPPKMPRPKPEDVTAVTQWLSHQLATEPQKNAAPGDTTTPAQMKSGGVTARRLNRIEYDNTVRDLLGVDLHPADDFPQDDSGYGFDNIGDVLSLSPVLMEKYLAAAENISRTAIFGVEPLKPTLVRLRSPERNQPIQLTPLTDYDLTGLSLPNAIHNTYRFPVDGEYVIRAHLGGQRPAGSEPIQLALWLDGQQIQVIHFDPAKVASFINSAERQELGGMTQEFRTKIVAGDHWLAVSIPYLYEGLPASYQGPNPSKLPAPPLPAFKPPPDLTPQQIEARRQEVEKRRAEKIPANSPRIRSLELGGPYAVTQGPSRESLKKIYACGHLDGHHKKGCARLIVEHLARRAYRRPVTPKEVTQLTGLIADVQRDGGAFEEGLATAIQAMLLSPHFLFRIEPIPAEQLTVAPARSLSQHELASRLSYFLWSSMPDDALLAAADRGRLIQPKALTAQVRRMLLDPKSHALVENFGGQWLQVRKLESVKPDRKRFPEFDEYLRLSMQRETEMFFESIVREDRSILDFIDANYTYLNERLARFYNVPNVQGAEFRKVSFAAEAHRGGLLGQASVLTVSSYANRTSPVLRGKWVLENLVGTPPPPPPPDVPNLDENKIGLSSSMREQLEQHRKNAICASCHTRMDPLGFGLENFDAIGAWRTKDGLFPINASGTLPDGRSFDGPQGLESILKAQPEAFAECLTRKLLIYALGRGLEPDDDPAVKQIVKNVAADNYRFSSLILGIVKSEPFQNRRRENER
jgi:mono/diheme cytochrome c family protein